MFDFFKRKKIINSEQPVVVALPADDATLQNYQQQAQDELPYLIAFMGEHDKDDDLFRYAIKARFEEKGEGEHMWVQVNEFKDGYFLGRLANEPVTMKLVKYGDNVRVAERDVEDWILEDFLTNTKVGAFAKKYTTTAQKQG